VTDPDGSWVKVLVDAGFDVWLGNNRGCVYSKGHKKYTHNDFEYFNYSFYEMGKFDLPAFITYILAKTGEKKLSYMGHSQGTSQMFSALAENKGNLRSKINLFIAMSPVVQLVHS
jgi:lysosomal acid lipase/cholesteryl ester hydrolase